MQNGMINAVGLQNPGVQHVINFELPQMKKYFHKKVIANVSGFPLMIMLTPALCLIKRSKSAFLR